MRKTGETAAEVRVFQSELLAWFRVHQRDLPWRRNRDPYAIWLSEIMLQQTRVAAVIPFYKRFLGRFPDFSALAAATESDLLAHWAGLGYYYRARNLQKAAQMMDALGEFPKEHEAIRSLPGVGDYTSAAVASIAFDLPFAAVDGNVVRVLSRVFAEGADSGSLSGKRRFAELADWLLAREEPGTFNQAMMELGATICLPKNPQCLLCPVAQQCGARELGWQTEFPVKLSKAKNVEEERSVFWIERDGMLLVWQRAPDSRLMPGFWELPERLQLPKAVLGDTLGEFRHGITVHNYRFQVLTGEVPDDVGVCQWMAVEALLRLPVSTVLRKAYRLVSRHSPVAQKRVAAGR